MAHMLRGEFEQAWRENDAIRQRDAPDAHRFWQGEALAGQRVIIRCLHGFGDAIQFLRYVPSVRKVAASVVVEVAPRLVGLARMLEGVDEVITWGEDAPATPPQWTVQIEVMELPYVFRTELRDLPIGRGYLRVPRTGLGPAALLRVGIMGTAGSWNTSRALPSACMQAILAVRGCEFWDLGQLQGGAATDSAETVLQVDPECRNSTVGLASLIARLDLVIAVDTLAPHVAGALGKPAWVMLQFAADWRWMHGREDSPWYPSLRLFRQAGAGDWESVQDAVIHALKRLVAAKADEGHAG